MESTGATVDDYVFNLPDDQRSTLAEVRRTIKVVAPDAVESIGYGIPAYKYRGKVLIYFGAAKKHCALYGTPEGTVKFPSDQPPPEEFLKAILDARMAEIDAAAAAKRKKPKG